MLNEFVYAMSLAEDVVAKETIFSKKIIHSEYEVPANPTALSCACYYC
jgi:hypothetical protein